MTQVVLIYCGDWAHFFIDGQAVYSGHSIRDEDFIDALNGVGKYKAHYGYCYNEEVTDYPETLLEILEAMTVSELDELCESIR